MVSITGGIPAFAAEHTLNRFADLVATTPSVVIVDMGVHVTPTQHPSFLRLAHNLVSSVQQRGGFLAVWVDQSTDRKSLLALAESAGQLVVAALPSAQPSDLDDFRHQPRFFVVDENEYNDYGLGVPLTARPDQTSPVLTDQLLGGCPIVEQRAFFVGTNGDAFACQRQMLLNEPINTYGSTGGDELVVGTWRQLRHSLRMDRRDKAMKSCAGCRLSYRGWINEAELRSFWRRNDDQGELLDLDERKHLFDTVIPMEHRVVKVDLGCGPVKRRGFVGIDRYPMPGVDVVADINQGIPLPDDSVDYLVASHSLEHFDDLPGIIQEINRVSRDRALVTIVAPYYATGLNIANPYHIQAFNEHTSRFFTNAAETALDVLDYDFPSAKQWGLASSDHSNWKADLRLLKCEFHYMPPYRGLDEAAKRVLRKSISDVVEQMVLQFVVVKSPMSASEFAQRQCNTVYQEPPAVTARRNEESMPGESNVFTELIDLPAKFAELKKQSLELKVGCNVSSSGFAELRPMVLSFNRRLESVEQSIALSDSVVAKRITAVNTELIRRTNEQTQKLADLQKMVAAMTALEADRVERPPPLVETHIPIEAPQIEVAELPEEKASQVRDVQRIFLRERGGPRLIRHLRLYRRRAQDLNALVAPAFSDLKSSAERQGLPKKGFKLQESELWRNGQEWIYNVPVNSGRLQGFEFAVTTLFKPHSPKLFFSCTIWSGDSSALLFGCNVMAQEDTSLNPLRINFAPVNVDQGTVHLKLTALPAVESLGVRVIEWRALNTIRQVRDVRLFCRPIYE